MNSAASIPVEESRTVIQTRRGRTVSVLRQRIVQTGVVYLTSEGAGSRYVFIDDGLVMRDNGHNTRGGEADALAWLQRAI